MGTTLQVKTDDVKAWCQAKGWYDQPSEFMEHMALLHSELSEAVEAWRKRGFEPWYVIKEDPRHADGSVAKPEGVPSELADVFIRLLDDCGRYGWDLWDNLPGYVRSGGQNLKVMGELSASGWSSVGHTFLNDITWLHRDISRVVDAYDYERPERMGQFFARLLAVCHFYGIDLEAEYERKMAYNWTRTYRHGAKAI